MADFIIYGIPQSTYVRSVCMACIEKGVPYSLVPHMPHSEKMNKLHPFGRVPAVRHGDFTLYETSAILRYIDEAFPGPPLSPTDLKARARMEQWISAINAYFYDAMVRHLVLPFFFPRTPDGKPDPVMMAEGAEEIRLPVKLIDEAVAEGPYLLGAELCLADLLLAPILFYVSLIPEGQTVLRATKNLARAGAAMRARQSFEKTLPPPPPENE